MSIQTAIDERTEKLRVILDYSNNAIRSKSGLPASDLNGLPEAITTIPQGTATTLQTKSVTPTGRTFVVTPDSGYNGFSAVSVAGDNNLTSENIAEGVTIYGVTGTFEGNGGGSAIPEPYASYIAEAEAVYTGEYANVIYAEGYGAVTGATYKTVMFLLDSWAISAYDAATTEYTHSGFFMVQKEDGGEWTLTDYSGTTASEHYAKNIKAASCYITYNGMTLFPVGQSGGSSSGGTLFAPVQFGREIPVMRITIEEFKEEL